MSPSHIMDHSRHGEHWPPALLTMTGTAFTMVYCISLCESECGPFMHTHTDKENIPDNLIHSGSSCNTKAAQQVVLWCLSLNVKIKVSDFCLTPLNGKKEHNLEKILLSLSFSFSLSLVLSLLHHNWPYSPTWTCTCVSAVCASRDNVLQKCCRRAEGI